MFWYRLDNAAMIFPPISGEQSPNTFCLSATLDRKIDKDILQKSVNQVLQSEETFRVRLKKGVFWYYLEENDKELIVEEEPPQFMEFVKYYYGSNHLFRVFYHENRISCVFFHALTDGTGGLYFLKQLIYTYLVNCGLKISTEGMVKPLEYPTLNEEKQDKFMNVAQKTKEKKIAETRALQLSGTPFKIFGTGVIVGECDTLKVKEQAKKYNTTITGYLCGVYLYSLYKAYIENKNPKNKNIAISIPVNIRKQHPSSTKRNFTLVARIAYDFSNGANLDDVLKESAKQLKTKLTKEQIDAQIQTNVSIEKNVFMKILPRALKTLALKIAYSIRGVKEESSNLSNLGNIELPADISSHVKDIRFILQASKTTQKNFSVTGYNGKLFLAFSRRHVENAAEKEFFRMLSNAGIDVTVASNYWEVGSEKM